MEDIALNQMLEYPSLSEEERKELEWLPEKLKETVDILCERADGPFWCDEQWIISEQFENEKEYRKFLRQVSGQEYYLSVSYTHLCRIRYVGDFPRAETFHQV